MIEDILYPISLWDVLEPYVCHEYFLPACAAAVVLLLLLIAAFRKRAEKYPPKLFDRIKGR